MINWDDDERSTRMTTFNQQENEEFIPINKILKELHDEEKEMMYCIDGPLNFNKRDDDPMYCTKDFINWDELYEDVDESTDDSSTTEESEIEEEIQSYKYNDDDMMYKGVYYI
jgi:hypothetical protein